MKKIRTEENALLIWNLEQARTAYISGEELNTLERWSQGENSSFIDRLKAFGLIIDEDRDTVKEAISYPNIKNPHLILFVHLKAFMWN